MDHVVANFGDGALDGGYGVVSACGGKTAETEAAASVLRCYVEADDENLAAIAAPDDAVDVGAGCEFGYL